jgi:WD40 repeat protein/uncharacterized protein YjbI with pentapeptide repeats
VAGHGTGGHTPDKRTPAGPPAGHPTGRRSARPLDRQLDFFISYSPPDERWATWIAATLEEAGYRTMLQVWDFVVGTNFIDLMDRGVSGSAVVLAVISRTYLTSRYGRMEWQAALRAAPDNPAAKLMTVRVERCELDGLLATITYVDLVDVDDPDRARSMLLRGVRGALSGRVEPDATPVFPGADLPTRPASPQLPHQPVPPQAAPPLPVPPQPVPSQTGAGGRMPPPTASRHRPALPPPYPPLATESAAGLAQLAVLHVAGPAFGRRPGGAAGSGGTVGSGGPAGLDGHDDPGDPVDAAGLQSRIFGDLTQLLQAGAPRPDLLVVSGDLTASGSRQEFEEAWDFLTRLRVRLGLGPDRVVTVPGGLDVNRAACRAYFNDCDADDEQPAAPYWPKWRHFTRMFERFYDGFDGILFEDGLPWTLFAVPELRVVVAGLNSSMAVSHREEDQFGLVGTDQAAWFAQHLRAYENDGWLRLGVMRHTPGSGLDALRDTAQFTTLVAPRLNLLIHGPGPAGPDPYPLGVELLCASAGGPGRAQLLTLTAGGLTRWVAGPDAPARTRRVAHRWRAVGATFLPEPEPRPAAATRPGAGPGAGSGTDAPGGTASAGAERSEVREIADSTSQLLDRMEEVIRARYERVRVQRIRPRQPQLPYLMVTYNDDGFVRQTCVAAHPGQPGPADVEALRRLVRAADPELSFELVYQTPPAQEVRQQARRAGLRMRSFTEFQGLLDLRAYVSRQTDRLAQDRQYPPRLYVDQRFNELDRSDRSARQGLVEELLDQLQSDHGRFILLLGDFGRGKTFALRELARRIPEELPHLTPIFIELRAMDKAHSVDGLVAAHLADHGERNIDIAAFQYMLRQGRIVLLFDGFDELVTRSTYERAAEHLDTLVGAAGGNAKIIVSSRTQHFRSREQVLTKLGERVGVLPHRRLLNVLPFTEEQVREYLVNHYGDERAADERLRLLSSVSNLMELSQNPRMLSFVADLATQRLRDVAETGNFSAAALYREILTNWLLVEEARTRGVPGAPTGFGLADLKQAVTKLAVRLWAANSSVLAIPDLAEVANTLTGMVRRQMSEEQATYALGSGTLLVRDENEQFGFIHSSVAEWLVANEIAQRLRSGDADLLSQRVLSQLTVDFLCDLDEEQLCRQWSASVLAAPPDADPDEVARANARKITTRLATQNANLRGRDLRHEDLSNRDFTGADFTGADLTGARLVRANLTRAVLRDVTLVGARLDRASLVDADLTGADLTRARLTGADLTGVTVTGSRWRMASLVGATHHPRLVERPELRGAAYTPGIPVETQVAPAMTGVPYGFDIKIGRLPQPLAYTGDGNLLAVGCDNGGVLVCDTESGRPLRTLRGHHGRVYAIAADAGTGVVSAGGDGTVRMWDAATGAQRWTDERVRAWVWPLAVSHQGSVVAISDDSGTVQLLDAANGRPRHALPGAVAPVWTGAFRGDDAQFASGGTDGVVRLWDVATGRLDRQLTGHSGSVYRVAYSPDGTWLVTADEAGAVRIFEVATGQVLRELTGHTRSVYTVAFHPGGRLLATADAGGSIRLWPLGRGRPPVLLDGHHNAVYQVIFSPDGRALMSGDSGGTLRLWTIDPDADVLAQVKTDLVGHRAAVWPGVFRPDGLQFATTSNDGATRLWDTTTGQCPHVLRGHGRRISSVSFNATDSLLATSGNDGVVRLWDPVSGQLVRVLKGTGDLLVSAVFSPVEVTVAAASNDGGVHLFNAETGTSRQEMQVETDNVWAEAFSRDGRVLATANDDDTVRLWSHQTGAQGFTLAEHRGRVRSIAFSPDGTTLATGCDDRKVRLWDTTTGVCLSTLEGHTDRVYSVAFDPTGTLLASASWDGRVRIWDVATRRERSVLRGRGGRLWTVAWHPGGDLVAAAGDDSVIQLWQPHTGAVRPTLAEHVGRVYALAFSSDGAMLASGGDDGTARLWDTRDPDAAAPRVTLVGHPDGWAAIGADGRYKVAGPLIGDFWHVVGTSRFEPGELEAHVGTITRIPLESPF